MIEEYENKVGFEQGINAATAVIPLNVNQANLQTKARIKFKW